MQHSRSAGRRDFLRTAGAVSAAAVSALSVADEASAAGNGLEVEAFARHLDSEFNLSVGSDSYFKAKLTEVKTLSAGPAGHRQPFSLVFTTSKRIKAKQETYTVSHPQLGRMRVFLVPVDGLAGDTHLEAVFG